MELDEYEADENPPIDCEKIASIIIYYINVKSLGPLSLKASPNSGESPYILMARASLEEAGFKVNEAKKLLSTLSEADVADWLEDEIYRPENVVRDPVYEEIVSCCMDSFNRGLSDIDSVFKNMRYCLRDRKLGEAIDSVRNMVAGVGGGKGG